MVMSINHINGCKSNWKTIDGKYYSFNKEMRTKSNASTACSSADGKLYEPKDKRNYENVLAIAKKNGIEFFWLGIIKGSKKGELIYQSDRCPIVLNLAPTSYTILHNYGCIKSNTNFKNRWYYNQCDGWKLSYVCEKDDNGKFEIWGLNISSTLLFKLEFLTYPLFTKSFLVNKLGR